MQFNVFQINNYSNNLRACFDLYLKSLGEIYITIIITKIKTFMTLTNNKQNSLFSFKSTFFFKIKKKTIYIK